MLVVFLILLTKVLADSDEDKYVDLLPDAEKQQFIEKVARRILLDVESKENGRKLSGELSDEQLKEHNDYVKAILKQESENIRRSKGEAAKDREEKPASAEHLDVKPLETEKIADDPDVDQVDLTLRNDRRDIDPNQENATDFIKVEIVRDEVPKTKRSVKNESFVESGSDESSEKHDATTTTTKLTEPTTETQDNSTESETTNVKPIDSKSTEHKVEITKNKESEHTESTTLTSNVVKRDSKSKESSETDGEDIHLRGIGGSERKSNQESDESNGNTTESDNNVGAEYYGVKSAENKSDEYNSVTSTDVEEFTTVTIAPETSTEVASTTQNADEYTEQSPSTVYVSGDSENNTVTNLTSSMVDEGTAESNDFTTHKTDVKYKTKHIDFSKVPTTAYTTESTIKPVITTTEEMKIIVEDFTSAPKINKSSKVAIITEKPSKTNFKLRLKIKQRAQESKESTATTMPLQETSKTTAREFTEGLTTERIPEKTESSTEKPTTVKVASKVKKYNYKQVKGNEVSQSADKNFIELEKVYYDKLKKKTPKEYEVYEIPANKPPFVQIDEPVTEQPYYVPVYNYSPNNAYFNPQNRLGPNADDVASELSTFAVEENADNTVVEENVKDMETNSNLDMEYSDTAFDTQRKKFGGKQKLSHNIHKIPQQSDSMEKKRGKVNAEDYLDSDYYFGRIRKDLERRGYQSGYDKFPNSDENAHPVHSILEMNLKDHVRAVRNILFRQKYFGPDPTTEREKLESEEEEKPEEKVVKLSEPENFSFKNDDDDKSAKNIKKDDNNNIAIDYYFGRIKSNATTELKSVDKKDAPSLKKVGYVKDENDKKTLFMIDKFFKDNVVNYIHEMKSNDKTFVKSDLITATPLPNPKSNRFFEVEKLKKDLQVVDKGKGTFRNEEIHRNAELNVINKTPNIDSIKQVINMVDEKDLFKNLQQMQDLRLRLHRRNDDEKMNVCLDILKDMVSVDNKALIQYDWLGTTVDIQASLQKLFELIAVVADNDDIHPSDLEILKYVVFLHKLAKEITEANDFGALLRKKLQLPRNRKRKERLLLKEKGLINRVWLYLRRKVPELDESGAMKNFNKFLMDVEDGFYDLHDAIKNVAKITKYKNQHWYQNIRDLYLNTGDRRLLELLLHMSVSRLFGLIEESAKNGLEDDYIEYMKKNKLEAKKTLEEMLFVMQIMDEINKNVE